MKRGYFHVVFSLPSQIADIAYHNKRVIYGLLLQVSADTMLRIAADPKRLGARIGITSVLHTWGSTMTHHPHVHMIVPGGGLSQDGTRWVAARPKYLLPVKVLSRLFRRRMLEELAKARAATELRFFNEHTALSERPAFTAFLAGGGYSPQHNDDILRHPSKGLSARPPAASKMRFVCTRTVLQLLTAVRGTSLKDSCVASNASGIAGIREGLGTSGSRRSHARD